MTKLCQSLEAEHRVIERVLQAMERELKQVEDHGTVDSGFFARAISFVREFADGLHHQKEEQVLFPHVTEAGVPEQGGPVGVMLGEHELARALIRQMDESLAGAASNNGPARHQLIDSGRSYIVLLRSHIQKEDGVLFPMAEEILPADVKARLQAGFAAAEKVNPQRDQTHRAWAENL